MSLYNATHTGLAQLNQAQLSSLALNGQQPLGFFKSADLRTMLDRSILSAGIRIYLAGKEAREKGRTSLVACGTKADGFDANEMNGLVANPLTKDPIFMRVKNPGVSLQADKLSRIEVKKEVTTDTFLTAFFSEAMVNNLLSAPEAQGISLFIAPLNPIKSEVPELFPFPTKYEANTFLAVARSEAKANAPFDPNTELRVVLSNLPCPGHCLAINANRMLSRGAVARSAVSFDRDPYINPWENESSSS